MAKLISEVIAEQTKVLQDVKAFVEKAEEKPVEPAEPTEETPAEEDVEPEGEDTVTKEMYDALCERVEKLEEALKASEEDKEKLVEVVEETTEALNRVNAYFKKPENRAQFAEGVEPKAMTEAGVVVAEENVFEKWMKMPSGKAANDFFKANEAEIMALMHK